MAGRSNRRGQSTSDAPPPKKRKKDEQEGDGLWDDSLEFTQADLDDLEVQASQAYVDTSLLQVNVSHQIETQQKASKSPVGPPTVSKGEKDDMGTFLMPQKSSSTSSSDGSHTRATGNSNNTGNETRRSSSAGNTSHGYTTKTCKNSASGSPAGASGGNVSTSTASGGNVSNPIAGGASLSTSSSGYPSSVSGYGRRSSSSLQSGSSSDLSDVIAWGQSSSMSRGISSDSLDLSAMLGRNQSLNQSAAGDVASHKRESLAFKLQVERMKEELCARDGENSLLRDNLHKRESELDGLRLERLQHDAQERRQHTLNDKAMQDDIARLKTQLQFKDQELREVGGRCRELEAQMKNIPLPSTMQQPAASQVSTKQPRKVCIAERTSPRPKVTSSYPTTSSFMGAEGSPRKLPNTPEGSPRKSANMAEDSPRKLPKMAEGSPKTSYAKIVTDSCTMTARLQRKRRTMNLDVPSGRRSSGCRLVAKLLNVAPSSVGTLVERGIVGLLQTPAVSDAPHHLQFERDRDSRLLSPVANKRISDVQVLMAEQEKTEKKSIVPTEHLNLAMRGLTGLLCEDCVSSPATSLTTTSSVTDTYVTIDSSSIHGDQRKTNTGFAVLLLPVINDYLHHYLEMLSLSFETLNISSPSKVSSSSSPESFGSLIESPTGSLGILLMDSTHYANNIETLALVSLRTLLTLVSVSEVRWVLLHSHDTHEVGPESRQNSDEMENHSYSKCFEASYTKPICLNTSIQVITKLYLLKKVLKMANPGSKGELYSAAIVETALRILTELACHCREQHIHCLLPVLSDEGLQNCLECDSRPSLVVQGLVLLKSMCKSNLIVSSLCSNATGCVLLTLYSLCRKVSIQSPTTMNSTLVIYSLVVSCLSCIASAHKGGLIMLLESDCQCSVQVVASLVELLHHVLQMYRSGREGRAGSGAGCCLDVLHDGLYLLHAMSQHTLNFTHQHMVVQHEYVALICGLSTIYKGFHRDREHELAALSDMWDFDQDDSELSQESDEEQDLSAMDDT